MKSVWDFSICLSNIKLLYCEGKKSMKEKKNALEDYSVYLGIQPWIRSRIWLELDLVRIKIYSTLRHLTFVLILCVQGTGPTT